MSTLISTRIKPLLLKEAEAITNSTDLAMSDLLRLGLRMVVKEFQASGGVRIADHGEPRTAGKRPLRSGPQPKPRRAGKA